MQAEKSCLVQLDQQKMNLLLGLHQNCYHQDHFQTEGFVFEKCGYFLFMWLDKLVVLP